MALLEFVDIEFAYSDKELYNKACLKLNPGEHACLVGVNGSGKSTLLSLAVGDLKPDKGKVIWEPHVTYSYLDQQMKVKMDMPVYAYLYGVYEHLFEKERQMMSLYAEASKMGNGYEKMLEKAARIGDELLNADFYSLQEKVGRIANGLGLKDEDMVKTLAILSSGMREKAYLAKMLLEEKEVLLMDEPTNFLDQGQVAWLASFLSNYPKAFLIVSHDEAFLEKIAGVVFCLENKTITRYKGSYEDYLINHELAKEQYEKNYQAQQRYIKKEEQFIAAHIVRATSAKAAKSRRTRLSHLDRLDAPTDSTINVHFRFPFSHHVGDKPLEIEELVIGYGKPLLDPISFLLKKGEKIAVLGKNGVGKTTFLKTIQSKIPSLGGRFAWLPGIEINAFDIDEKLDLELTPFEYVKAFYPSLDNTAVRSALASTGVRKEMALRKMKELSGGELTKTRFAIMSLRKSNFLILDEPTNHLDAAAKESLFGAIEEYPGSVIIVSHEKDFYDGLVDYEIHF